MPENSDIISQLWSHICSGGWENEENSGEANEMTSKDLDKLSHVGKFQEYRKYSMMVSGILNSLNWNCDTLRRSAEYDKIKYLTYEPASGPHIVHNSENGNKKCKINNHDDSDEINEARGHIKVRAFRSEVRI